MACRLPVRIQKGLLQLRGAVQLCFSMSVLRLSEAVRSTRSFSLEFMECVCQGYEADERERRKERET